MVESKHYGIGKSLTIADVPVGPMVRFISGVPVAAFPKGRWHLKVFEEIATASYVFISIYIYGILYIYINLCRAPEAIKRSYVLSAR